MNENKAKKRMKIKSKRNILDKKENKKKWKIMHEMSTGKLGAIKYCCCECRNSVEVWTCID